MESAIQFILDSQAKFFTDIESLKESQKQLIESQQKTDAQLQSLIEERREGFNNLIVANDVTGDLANKIGTLTIQTSQRVTKLEEKIGEA
jgi:hypothetical protein